MKRILIIGLEPKEVQKIRFGLAFNIVVIQYFMLPKLRLIKGALYVESIRVNGKYLVVDKVVFHGIYADDFDFITLLALWGGPCLPNAKAMMDLRQRIPALVRSLGISIFGEMPRGMVLGKEHYKSETEVVAKWGVWHCGEEKHKFSGQWESPETSLIEPFILGEAVRVMMIGNKFWQIKLTGDSWLKSIHHKNAKRMKLDEALFEDSLTHIMY